MTISTRSRALALVLAAMLALGAMPAAAFAADQDHGTLAAAGMTPLANTPKDAYEADDTPEQAKPMPAASFHTWHPLPNGDNDIDWMYFSIDATGTPVLLETYSPVQGVSFTDPYIKVYDEAGVGGWQISPWVYDGELATNDDHLSWSMDAGMVFVAPHPGKYFVRVQSDDTGSGQWGEYWLFGYKGIGRRLAGPDRCDTAVAVNRLLWSFATNAEGGFYRGEMSGIVFANGRTPNDALAAAIYAARTNSPLLLTNGAWSLTPATRAEFERLAQASFFTGTRATATGSLGKIPVIIVGGNGSVSPALAASLGANQYVGDVKRLAGPDRYTTMVAVMDELRAMTGTQWAFVASGETPADVAAAAPVANALNGSLFLTKKWGVPAATMSAIATRGITDIVVVGGTGSVSDTTYAQLRTLVASDANIRRVSGLTRYSTAKALADFQIANGPSNTSRMVLVSGLAIGDSPAAIPLATAMGNAPVLLTQPRILSTEVRTFMDENRGISGVSYMVGGAGSVYPSVYNLWNRYGWPLPTSAR